MNCRFCWAEFRPDYGYQCGSGPGRDQRTMYCHDREIARFRVRVSRLESELAEWQDYAQGLEESGDAMKEGATTPEQIAWDRQIKRRPEA